MALIPGSGNSPRVGNDNPFHYSCVENPMDRGAWWAAVHGVTKSWTQLSDWTHTHIPIYSLPSVPWGRLLLGPLRYCLQASTQTFCLLINTLCLGDSDLSQVYFSSQHFHISRLESDCLSVSETHCCSIAKSCVTLCDPMDCSTPGRQASLSFAISQSLLKLKSVESVMPSNHLRDTYSILSTVPILSSISPTLIVFLGSVHGTVVHTFFQIRAGSHPKCSSLFLSYFLNHYLRYLLSICFFPGSWHWNQIYLSKMFIMSLIQVISE